MKLCILKCKHCITLQLVIIWQQGGKSDVGSQKIEDNNLSESQMFNANHMIYCVLIYSMFHVLDGGYECLRRESTEWSKLILISHISFPSLFQLYIQDWSRAWCLRVLDVEVQTDEQNASDQSRHESEEHQLLKETALLKFDSKLVLLLGKLVTFTTEEGVADIFHFLLAN